MEKEDRQIIGNICELIPKLTPQERNNLMYLTEGMTLMSRKGMRNQKMKERRNKMNKLDKAISDLGADAAISTSLHLVYLKSKGEVWQQHLGGCPRLGSRRAVKG